MKEKRFYKQSKQELQSGQRWNSDQNQGSEKASNSLIQWFLEQEGLQPEVRCFGKSLVQLQTEIG